MLLHVDPAGDLPIYEQIVRQVKFAIAAGALAAGDMISSVRELAKELAINPNTVIRAYRQLQDEDILQSRRGTGLVVGPAAPETCRRQRIDMIRDRLGQVLTEARQSGLRDGHVGRLIREQLAVAFPDAADVDADADASQTPTQPEEISS